MMKRVALVLGWIILAMAAGLIMLGILNLPPRGLMFALPFVFIIPGFNERFEATPEAGAY